MKRYIVIAGVVAVLFVSLSVADTMLPQQQVVKASLLVTNASCKGGVQISQIAFLKAALPIAIQIFSPPAEVPINTRREFVFELKDTPTSASIKGTIEREKPLDVNAAVGTTQYPCGTIQLSLSGGQPPGQKPIAPGQSLDQVLQVLKGLGFSIRQEGSKDKPKLGDVSEPMLVRAIAGLSAHVVFVSAPGSLRSVITWDQPALDLDLIVFGLPGGFCFQLNAAGVLSETCDRPPSGPVLGAVFAVVIINWSPTPQAYVLSLSP